MSHILNTLLPMDGYVCWNSKCYLLGLSFYDEGKQISIFGFVSSIQMEVCHFRFLFAADKRKLPFSICSRTMYILYSIHIHVHIHILLFQTENGSPEVFSLICSLFAHYTKERLSYVHLLTKKQTEVIGLYIY